MIFLKNLVLITKFYQQARLYLTELLFLSFTPTRRFTTWQLTLKLEEETCLFYFYCIYKNV